MGHSYNNGLHTSSKGITFDAVRVGDLNLATPVVKEDAKSGLISSVAKTATGTYELQLSAPYPPKLVVCIPHVSNVNGTTDLRFASIKEGGYNATTGKLTIFVSDDDDVGAPVLADGAAGQELHVVLAFNRYTN